MGYRCLNCGHADSFDATQQVTQFCTEDITISSDGDISDYGDSNVNDSEVTDGPNDIECCGCGSSDVEWFEEEEEYLERKAQYDEENNPINVPNWKQKIVGTTWKDRMEAKPN